MRFLTLLLPFICCVVFADEVSVTAPDWYDDVLESHLTPFDELNLNPAEALIEDEIGVVLLSEAVYRIRPNGAKDVVYHYVYRPLTEKGVEQVQEERFSFSAEQQKIHLIRARTITPEGKVIEASKDGIFLQRPEGNRASSIYDDREDLVVIYSDVKVGSLVEVVVLREELEPRVTGEVSGVMSWGKSGWPTVQRRKVVGVDAEMNQRLKILPIGKAVPTAKISQAKGFTWYDWTARDLASRPYEVNRPSSLQTGPSIWYTSFQSWEQVGQWYGQLVEPQGLMESPLRAEVEKAVGDLSEPREVLKALFPLAAKKVRYTGLEFGHSGIFPYSCNQVWDRKYGDCKDKSVLLVSMLKSRGIKAWVGLVNTEGEGLIPREAPGTRMFDHAIAIVDVDPGEGEELVFCDPTMSYGAAGIISPAVANRDVLLTSPEGGRLVKSPEVNAGSYDYDFDIEMDEVGRISGWMKWKSSGYYAISTASSYDGLDRESMRSRFTKIVEDFFPSAEVVDFEVPEDFASGKEECLIKVFFTTAVNKSPADVHIPVNFPSSSSFFMNYGDQKTRESKYFQWQDSIRISMTLKLAEGLVPLVLHPPLQALSPGYHIDAQWEFKAKELKASLEVHCLKSLLEPDEVLAAQQASRAWSQWSDQPLLLKAGKDWKPPVAGSEMKLPLMPTGQGQLELVQRWYPLAQESKRRKRALEKILQLFPDDADTLYETRLSLAYIHFYAGRYLEAAAAYGELADHFPKGVSADSYSAASYMSGLAYCEMKKFKEAVPLFKKSLEVEGLSTYRQGWGLTMQAQALMRLGQLDQAIQIGLEAEKIDSSHRAEVFNDLIHCYLKKENFTEAIATWKRCHAILNDEAMTVLERLASEAADPLLASNDQLKTFFEELRPELEKEEAKALDVLVSDFSYQREKLKKSADLRLKLLEVLEETFPDYLSKDLYQNYADQETYQAKLKEALANDSKQWLKLSYGYLERFEVNDDFTGYFWNLLRHVKWKESALSESQQALMKALIPLIELIPHQDDNYWDCQFTTAEWHQEQNDWKKSEEILRVMPQDPLFNDEFAASAWRRRGIALEHLGEWEEAVKVHLHLEGKKMDSEKSCDQLMRAGWILARLGRFDEALETWSLLKEVPKTLYESLDDADLIEEAVVLAAMPEKTKAYWKQTEKWWEGTLKPYLKANDLKIPAEPLLSDHRQELKIHKVLEKEVKDIDVDSLGEIMTIVLSGARYFPSFTERTQDLFESYVRPITVARNEDFRKVAMALLETVHAGADPVQVAAATQALFYKVVLKKEDALEHGYRLLEDLEGEEFDAARELVLRRLTLVATRDKKDLKKLEDLLRKDWKLGGRDKGRVNIGVAISQVLEAQGETEKAIDFAKGIIALPVVQKNPENLKGVERYLKNLEGESNEKRAFIDHIESIHEQKPVPWLSQVSPSSLDEERFEDPADFLENSGEARHALEDYKWGYLLLKSDLITQEQREKVFESLLTFHLNSCLKNKEYNFLVDQVLENERLPEVMRRSFLWASAVDASFIQIDEKRVQVLADHPLSEGLREDLRKQGFQDLLMVSRVKRQGVDEQIAQMKEIVGRGELGVVAAGCVQNISGAIPSAFDQEAAQQVENLLKTAQFSGSSSREMRQEAIKYRKMVAQISEKFEYVPVLKSAFQKRLVELAEKAPTDWDDYRNYNDDLHLEEELAVALCAKLILEGIPQEMVQESPWDLVIPHLFVRNGKTLDSEALQLFLTSLDQVESSEAVSFAFGLVLRVPSFSEDLRSQSLKQCRPWVESKKDRDLADALLGTEFSVGLTSLSEKEILRLARKWSRLEEPEDVMNCMSLLEMVFDRENQAPLKAILRNLPEGFLLSRGVSLMAMEGYQQLGEDDEVEFFQEAVIESLPNAWMSAWGYQEVLKYQIAVAAYWVTQKKEKGPIPVWMKEIPKTMALKVERVRCEVALLLTEEKYQEFEDLVIQSADLLEEAEMRVLRACGDLGLKKKGARERAEKILHSPDKIDSYTFYLREMLKD